MNVIPASSAAWIVRTARAVSGRPSIDSGMPPRPMALTVRSPIVRRCTGVPFSSCCGSVDHRQLPRLPDDAVVLVPDHNVLVEPPTVQHSCAYGDPEPAILRLCPQECGHLDRGRP